MDTASTDLDEMAAEVPKPKKQGRPRSAEKKDKDFRCRMSEEELERFMAVMGGKNKSVCVREAIEDYVKKCTIANTVYNFDAPQMKAIEYLQTRKLKTIQLRLIEKIINEDDKDRLLIYMQQELGRKIL